MLGEWLHHARERIRRIFAPKSLGRRGEAEARKHLKRRGYKIVGGGERDFLGELDIVAVDGRTVVFVEVKTRATHDAGHPAEAVDNKKQRRLTRLALSYLRRHGLLENAVRFDVIAITWPTDAKRPTMEHIENAFSAVGRDSLFS